MPLVAIQVSACTSVGEAVFICGNIPQFGEWQINKACPLKAQSNRNNESNTRRIWTRNFEIEIGTKLQFRFLIIRKLINSAPNENHLHTVKKWETGMEPRNFTIQETTTVIECGKFGEIDNIKKWDGGWMTGNTEIRLSLFYNNDSVVMFNENFKSLEFSVSLSAYYLNDDISGNSSELFDNFNVQSCVLTEPNAEFQPQSKFGRHLKKGSYVVFSAQTPANPNNTGLTLNFSAAPQSNNHSHLFGSVIGQAHFLPSNLTGSSGNATVPICGNRSRPIGQISVSYLKIHSPTNLWLDCSRTFCRHFSNFNRALDVGHRGSGKSFGAAQAVQSEFSAIKENTLASFKVAAQSGADMIEFDLQMTKDNQLVVFHDFSCLLSLKMKVAGSHTDYHRVYVKDLTLKQLQELQIDHNSANERAEVSSPSLCSVDLFSALDCSLEEQQPFPTLKMVLEEVPADCGFNIEIKYPMILDNGDAEVPGEYCDINTYVDLILHDIKNYAGSRIIFFSSFSPEICTLLRKKQNVYPVIFLTSCGSSELGAYKHVVGSTSDFSINFCRAERLLGIAPGDLNVYSEIDFVDRCHQAALIVFVWGDTINKRAERNKLRSMGVEALIYDRSHDCRDWDQSIFIIERKNKEALLGSSIPLPQRSPHPIVDQFNDDNAEDENHFEEFDFFGLIP